MTLLQASMPWSDVARIHMLAYVARADALRTWRARMGKALAAARRGAGLTQEDAAEKLGVDKQTISRWETGTNSLKGYDLARLAQLYRMPSKWIVSPPDSIDALRRYELRRKEERTAGLTPSDWEAEPVPDDTPLMDMLHRARMSGLEEGLRRSAEGPGDLAPEPLSPSLERQIRDTATGRG